MRRCQAMKITPPRSRELTRSSLGAGLAGKRCAPLSTQAINFPRLLKSTPSAIIRGAHPQAISSIAIPPMARSRTCGWKTVRSTIPANVFPEASHHCLAEMSKIILRWAASAGIFRAHSLTISRYDMAEAKSPTSWRIRSTPPSGRNRQPVSNQAILSTMNCSFRLISCSPTMSGWPAKLPWPLAGRISRKAMKQSRVNSPLTRQDRLVRPIRLVSATLTEHQRLLARLCHPLPGSIAPTLPIRSIRWLA